MRRVEAKACFAGHGDASAITCIFFSGYVVIFAHEGNTSFGTVKGLLLFVCTHNINKTLCFYKIKKTNDALSAVSSWTGALHKNEPKYMPHRHDKYRLSIESFKLLLNEIKQIDYSTSNEETASQGWQLHPCNTDWCWCFHQRGNFFSSLIDGCLIYKNKEKPKTGPRPGPRLNYDVKIGPKPGPRGVKKSGPIRPGLKCRVVILSNSIFFLDITHSHTHTLTHSHTHTPIN